jgi:hypothetical protein
VNKLILAAALLALPLAARAEMGLRLGADATIANHDQSGTHVITDNWPLGADVMLSYWTPGSLLSLDLELGEAFILSPPTVAGVTAGKRMGTVLRPGIRLSPPILPLYLRAAVPINIESPSPYDQGRGTYGLRLGAGITIPLILFKIYIEGDADFPLGGGTAAPSAFSNWNLVLNGGLDFRF